MFSLHDDLSVRAKGKDLAETRTHGSARKALQVFAQPDKALGEGLMHIDCGGGARRDRPAHQPCELAIKRERRGNAW